jgi:hypothetical protein
MSCGPQVKNGHGAKKTGENCHQPGELCQVMTRHWDGPPRASAMRDGPLSAARRRRKCNLSGPSPAPPPSATQYVNQFPTLRPSSHSVARFWNIDPCRRPTLHAPPPTRIYIILSTQFSRCHRNFHVVRQVLTIMISTYQPLRSTGRSQVIQ